MPCKIHNINGPHMNLLETVAELDAFFEQDCGFEPEIARRLGTLAAASLIEPVGGLSLKAEGGGSCLNDCADECIFEDQPVGDMQDCMCICVEDRCGTSFGPACTEAGIPPEPAAK